MNYTQFGFVVTVASIILLVGTASAAWLLGVFGGMMLIGYGLGKQIITAADTVGA